MATFNKRTFSPSSFAKHSAKLALQTPGIIMTLIRNELEPAFRERILLVVTSVNQCRYCEWMHTDLAESSGVGKEEIKLLFNHQFDDMPEREVAALRYALHYADSNAEPNAAEVQTLYEVYGSTTAQAIEHLTAMIFFANLSGNTFDSFLSRLRGAPSEDSNLAFELVFSICAAPVLLAVAVASKNDTNPLKEMSH